MIQNEMGFEIQWEYVIMLAGIMMILVAFVYVLYNTTSSVREAVHKNFGTGNDYVEAAPSNETNTASVRLVLRDLPGG
ncbi:MAG: hypothetical protein WCX64_03710 [Candidatus Micrarchaeia archaeon]|jgi:hypothetical protein